MALWIFERINQRIILISLLKTPHGTKLSAESNADVEWHSEMARFCPFSERRLTGP